MNIYHYLLLSIQLMGFLINLHYNGQKKDESSSFYNAKHSFYATIVVFTLVILSSLK